MTTYQLSHLRSLEAESIHVLREVVAELERPALLFSGGKDSAVLLRLAEKAVWPQRLHIPLLHVDTGQNFPEVLDFRDARVAEAGVDIVVASLQESIDAGRIADPGPGASRNRLQSAALLEALARYRFDGLIGGARRDEEKARAKERVFSFRDEFGQWDPRNQRPEVWNLYNTRHLPGEHFRIFPLSNWTERDVWEYIAEEAIAVPTIYFAHRRRVYRHHDLLWAVGPWTQPAPGEQTFDATVRYRTVGDMTCTAALESSAGTVEEVLVELSSSTVSERGASRADDRFSEAAMEDRKREGYF
ncbi:MAG: sulfate adenylyltransferase subunit 2 [Actinomycetota bacterium]|nr:sulfate adenylyltransferase subunit 2 [Actinomycetota bacterium]